MKKSTSCCRIKATAGGVGMSRKYTKVEELSKVVFELKASGKTNREIGEMYGLTKTQVKGLVKRQNRKAKLIASGYVPRSKGRPRKESDSEEQRERDELVQLRMTVELLRNFLSEAGGR